MSEPDEVLLDRNDPAPFFGILTPEKIYSLYQQDLAACEVIKSNYVTCPGPNESATETYFFLGLAAGAVGAFAIGLGLSQ